MTDKEMAKEYIQNGDVFDNNKVTIKSVEQAFLAGLKAGRKSLWHKVADGDLPKISKPCLVYLANDSVITARLREDNVWTTNGCNAFENVIAWCEIPDFEEEVKECRI